VVVLIIGENLNGVVSMLLDPFSIGDPIFETVVFGYLTAYLTFFTHDQY